jgi:hypothetical protein
MAISQRIVDHGYAAVMSEIKKADHLYVKVGFPVEGELAAGNAKDISEINLIAAVQEFGSEKRNVPERSFIRATFDSEYENLQRFKEHEYLQIVQGKQTALMAIGQIGEWLTNKTKGYIRNIIPPPLKEATKKRKGRGGDSAVPLIDTGQMINTIQWVITEVKS